MPFNSKQYEFSDITVIMGGRDITGLRGIKYSEKQEKEALFAKGNKAHSIQRGNISYEGEITLTQSEYEALRLAGDGSVMPLSFNIQVSYGNPSTGAVMITDELQFAEFTEAAKELKQGDKFMEITLPFICLNVIKVS